MADAIIVLGRGIHEDGSLPIDPRSRVRKAAELYREGLAPFVIMSGGYSYKAGFVPPHSEATAMKKYALALGIPGDAIFEETRSLHTIGNAYFTKKQIIEPQGWREIALVTSDEHMPRAAFIFEKMYGPEYDFQPHISERVLSAEAYQHEYEHELQSMERITRNFAHIQPGDDETIRQHVLQMNPQDTMTITFNDNQS